MIKVRIAGVPEHFNLPWHMAIEEGAFNNRGIQLEWLETPEGTGKMCKLLQEHKTDLAIILTEGVVKSIVEGNASRIVQGYVASPLQWGIHVAHDSSFHKLDDLKGTKAAISRFGSGSHLMSYVFAESQGWETSALSFEVINTLDGAVEALQQGNADYFMWEHFTTKPLVTSRVFRRLGDCPTPWPCFVIAATNQFVADHPRVLRHILEVINSYTSEFKSIPSIDRTLANRYGLALEDVQEWLGITVWSQDQLSNQDIDNVQSRLNKLKLISNRVSVDNILTTV